MLSTLTRNFFKTSPPPSPPLTDAQIANQRKRLATKRLAAEADFARDDQSLLAAETKAHEAWQAKLREATLAKDRYLAAKAARSTARFRAQSITMSVDHELRQPPLNRDHDQINAFRERLLDLRDYRLRTDALSLVVTPPSSSRNLINMAKIEPREQSNANGVRACLAAVKEGLIHCDRLKLAAYESVDVELQRISDAIPLHLLEVFDEDHGRPPELGAA